MGGGMRHGMHEATWLGMFEAGLDAAAGSLGASFASPSAAPYTLFFAFVRHVPPLVRRCMLPTATGGGRVLRASAEAGARDLQAGGGT